MTTENLYRELKRYVAKEEERLQAVNKTLFTSVEQPVRVRAKELVRTIRPAA